MVSPAANRIKSPFAPRSCALRGLRFSWGAHLSRSERRHSPYNFPQRMAFTFSWRTPMRRWLVLLFVVPLFVSAVHAQDALKLGEPVGKLKFTDIRYLPRTLDDFGPKKAYVLVFINTSCPLVQR